MAGRPGRRIDPTDDVLWAICAALLAGIALALVGLRLCTTSPSAGQLIDGTDRDARCSAVVGSSRLLLCALIAVCPVVATAVTGAVVRRPLPAFVAGAVSVVALVALLAWIGAAQDYDVLP